VPAIRSLAVFFDPLHTDVDVLKELITGPLETDMPPRVIVTKFRSSTVKRQAWI
jgi:hypothetical protein